MSNKIEERNKLLEACQRGDAEDIKQFLSQTKAWGQPIFTTEDLLTAVIRPLINKEKKFDDIYNGLIYSEKTYLKKLKADKKETIDESQFLERENCIIAIIEHEKNLLKTSYPDMPPEEIKKFVADKLLNNTNKSPLFELAYVGPYSRILGVLTKELGVENINFLSRNKNYYTPMETINRFKKSTHYHVLESYLCEYLKMTYENKNSNSLYREVLNFFNTKYPSTASLFKLKMQEFPRILENAKKQAESDLKKQYGDEFDVKKFNDQEDEFMNKFMPDAYQIQKNERKNYKEIAVTNAFITSVGTLFIGVIALPFFILWYRIQKKNEPIKKETITRLESAEKKDQRQNEQAGEDFSNVSLSQSGSYSEVKELLKGAPVKTTTNNEKQPSAWHKTGTVSLREGNKMTVFSLKARQDRQSHTKSEPGLRS